MVWLSFVWVVEKHLPKPAINVTLIFGKNNNLKKRADLCVHRQSSNCVTSPDVSSVFKKSESGMLVISVSSIRQTNRLRSYAGLILIDWQQVLHKLIFYDSIYLVIHCQRKCRSPENERKKVDCGG